MTRPPRFSLLTAAILLVPATSLVAQDRTLASIRASGDSAWSAGDRRAAFASYDAVVRSDSTAEPLALLRLGTLHGWAGRLREAIACHRKYVALRPVDAEGRIALGRSLAWASKFDAALVQYDTALVYAPGSSEAALGRATVLAWSGRVHEATATLAAWQRTHADDAASAVLRARYLPWEGRVGIARQLHDSLAASGAPGRLTVDALEQWKWVDAAYQRSADLAVVHVEDSEGNRVTTTDLGVRTRQMRHVRFESKWRTRQVSRDGGAGPSLLIPSFLLALEWTRSVSSWRLDVGLSDLGEATEASTLATTALRYSRALGERLALATSAGLEPFDELAATADAALVLARADLDLRFRLRPSLAVTGSVGGGSVWSPLSDNNPVSRGALSLEWRPRRHVGVTIGHRLTSWADPAPGLYFAPHRFGVTESALRWDTTRDLGLVLGGEAGLGLQAISLAPGNEESSVAPRGSLRVGWRAAPGREIISSFGWTATAASGTLDASGYSARVATLSARWTF